MRTFLPGANEESGGKVDLKTEASEKEERSSASHSSKRQSDCTAVAAVGPKNVT